MQFMRMITISILAGIVAAGLVWLLCELVHKFRADSPPQDKDTP